MTINRYIWLFFLLGAMLFASIGNVAAVSGGVKVKRSDRFIRVKYGFPIEERDTIVTGENARVQVILKDGTVVTIGENSEYAFESYRFSDESASTVSMRLKRGFFRVMTGEIGKIAPERFKVHTKSATIGIRGTFFFGLLTQKAEKIGCIDGMIVVRTSEGVFRLKAGETLSSDSGGSWQKGAGASSATNGVPAKASSSPLSDQMPQNTLIQGAAHALSPTLPPSLPPGCDGK